MSLPNIIVAGTQKSGTTWLHQALSKSSSIFGSEVKELNFFNQRDFEDNIGLYEKNFISEKAKRARYRLESTPHYFQLPFNGLDIAANIKSTLNNPKIIVLLRNPVKRYESAYIHHMMQGRFEYVPFINAMTNEHKMLSFGRYAEILRHWLSVFPEMIVEPYWRVKSEKVQLMSEIFMKLDIDESITKTDLDFLTNAKDKKIDKLGEEWHKMPKLTRNLHNRLTDYYNPIVEELSGLVDWDVTPLMSTKVEID